MLKEKLKNWKKNPFSLPYDFVCFQKFRFCGDGDCPDWVLAEIYSSLSVLSSVKLKILTQMVAKSLLQEFIPVHL